MYLTVLGCEPGNNTVPFTKDSYYWWFHKHFFLEGNQ